MKRNQNIGFLLPAALIAAAVLWFFMFSPWTKGCVNFWLMMSASGVILSLFAFRGRRKWNDEIRFSSATVVEALLIAVALWAVFWVGDKVAAWMFSFSRAQIAAIYSLKEGEPALTVGLVLLFLIGPAEEIFWRGYVQHALSLRFGRDGGFIIATFCYTMVHVWSFNLMLLLSAMVVGGVWGLLYRFFPNRLCSIIISHALWDCAVFVIFPI